MESAGVLIGRALRDAREQRGLSLRAAAQLSANRFRPSSIAGYERGERAISVVRFCELAELYGVAPDQLFVRALRSEDGTPHEVVVDLSDVDDLEGPEGQLVLTFVSNLLMQRGENDSGTIRIRTPEVEIMASRRAPEDAHAATGSAGESDELSPSAPEGEPAQTPRT